MRPCSRNGPQPVRETWLVGDATRGDDVHMRRLVAFGQGGIAAQTAQRRTPSARSEKPSMRMKGDRRWLEDGQVTPLLQCSCGRCGGAFAAKPRGGQAVEPYCEGCRDALHPVPEPAAAEQLWRAGLHTDAPRPIPRPGKVAERPRCTLCGAMEPHVCPAKGRGPPAFDSPEDRRLVGFADRGVRRYHPETRSEDHHAGWTSGPWSSSAHHRSTSSETMRSSGSRVRLAKAALQHGHPAEELLRKGTPFASPVMSSASSQRGEKVAPAHRPVFSQEPPVQSRSQQAEASSRLARWEARRAAHVARNGAMTG
eukprot:TRINITY_DN96015_c0_g1_i1.p1 TRINITY_DN96015_c0_g1~~TRINITY_DN96015_c0_g1_i1.p1  ORF type:complete len:311 (-),score=43.93 TRINITY_DN96015_c0_g1_i1:12-944(-)